MREQHPKEKTEPHHRIFDIPTRNDTLYDNWSLVHLFTGVLVGWLVDPFIGLLVMALWEPLEVLVLSPLLMKRGIVFGYESIRNSLSDIFFDAVGIILGYYLLRQIIEPPFILF